MRRLAGRPPVEGTVTQSRTRSRPEQRQSASRSSAMPAPMGSSSTRPTRASLARRATFTVLRDVDRRLLERSVLGDLLSLGSEPGVEKALEDSRGRIANWLIEREAKTVDDGESALTHPSLRLTRLRALLHLVDSEAQDSKNVSEESLRRVNRVVERLLIGVRNEPPKVLRRAMFATLARGLDALLRAEVLDQALLVFRTRLATRCWPTCRHSHKVPVRRCSFAGYDQR